MADLPDSVRAVLISRVDWLPAGLRSLLRSAAVLGRAFEVELLERLDSCGPVSEAFGQLAATELVERAGPDRYRFALALTREAVYEGIPLAERYRLHKLAADALADVHGGAASGLPALAYHLVQAPGLGRGDLGVRHSRRAGSAHRVGRRGAADVPGRDRTARAARRGPVDPARALADRSPDRRRADAPWPPASPRQPSRQPRHPCRSAPRSVTSTSAGRGEGVGEVALLRDIPRTATVVAHTDVAVYKLDRDPFLTAVTGHAPTRRQADRIAGTRLAAGAAPADNDTAG